MGFVEALGHGSPRIRARTLGASVDGREIPYLEVSLGEFGADRDGKVLALLYAQQHGNEPSGKEAALAFALELARGDHDELLRHVDLLLVPQLNPDGGEADRRRTAAGVDLNRSHLILDGIEVEHLRELFHRWEPEVTADLHQYDPWSGSWLERGWLRLFDVQIGVPTNLNTDPVIRELAERGFLPAAVQALEARGFTGHNYIVGTPGSLRWSTTDVNDGRQGFAILNTLSFIFEGKRSAPPAADIERRAEAQRVAMEALLRFAAEHRDEVLRTVRGARERLAAGELDEFVLTMGRAPGEDPLEIPVESVREVGGEWVVGDTVTAVIPDFLPEVVARKVVPLPDAYLVPGEEGGILDLLRRHAVETLPLSGGEEMDVEMVRITGWVSEDLEGPVRLPVVEAERRRITGRSTDVLVPTRQLRGLLVATALEPESMHGLLRYEDFAHLAREGPYPVARVFLDRP
jgi:hypothetical protein